MPPIEWEINIPLSEYKINKKVLFSPLTPLTVDGVTGLSKVCGVGEGPSRGVDFFNPRLTAKGAPKVMGLHNSPPCLPSLGLVLTGRWSNQKLNLPSGKIQ